MFFNFTLP